MEAYEKAIGARSRGLVRGRCAWNDGRECWLADFPLVVLLINRMRTARARKFRATALQQSLLLMSGRDDVAKSMAEYWRRERMCRPDSALLQFLGAAVDHELPTTTPCSSPDAGCLQPMPPLAADRDQLTQVCSEALARAIPEVSRLMLEVFTAKIEELSLRMATAQTEWQTAALQKVEATLREARATPALVIDVDAQEHPPSDDTPCGSSPVKVGRFLQDRWRDEWTLAGVDVKHCLLQYAMLLKTRATKLHGTTSHGAQTYTIKNVPLMQTCFEEDLAPPSNALARNARDEASGDFAVESPQTQVDAFRRREVLVQSKTVPLILDKAKRKTDADARPPPLQPKIDHYFREQLRKGQ